MGSLAGQSALVTGAGRGIGKALAQRLAAEGAHVTVTARSRQQVEETAAQIESSGGKAQAIVTDVTDEAGVAQVVAAAARRFGPVSILVNNAGLPGPFGPIGDTDPLTWWASHKVHVLGPLLFMNAVIPGMRARSDGGRIINIVSSAGLQPIPNLSAYAVGKATAIRLTENVDLEERNHGIRAFALQPGTIITAMAQDTIGSPEAQRHIPEGIAMLQSRTPEDSARDLGRCGEVVVALAGRKYDGLGGRYLDIDWDLEAKLQELWRTAV
jgi:NAD(P)-dependent dehydrogenase (short-subunit alcohol dehydrogenase family)